MNIEKIIRPEELLDEKGNFLLKTRAIAQLMRACCLQRLNDSNDLNTLLYRAGLLFPGSLKKFGGKYDFRLKYDFFGTTECIRMDDLMRHLGMDISMHSCEMPMEIWLEQMEECLDASLEFAFRFKCPLAHRFADESMNSEVPGAKSLTDKAPQPDDNKIFDIGVRAHMLCRKLDSAALRAFQMHLNNFEAIQKLRAKQTKSKAKFNFLLVSDYLRKSILSRLLRYFDKNNPAFDAESYVMHFSKIIWLIANGFMEIDEDGCYFIPNRWDFGLNEWLEGVLETEYFYDVYFSIELYELEEAFVGLY